MKILFLQKVDNARGGVTNVNINLITYFLSLNHEVDIVSLRHGDSWENVVYPHGSNVYLINQEDVWGCPLLREIIAYAKRGCLIKAANLLVNRIIYKKKMMKDYKSCQNLIEKLAPDVIINSHYEILAGINDQYLKKTVMHFHTSFDQVLQNRSYVKTFEKYASKIYGFVWLSEKTKKEAVEHGFINSRCIYNSLAFSEKQSADMSNKKVLFIGRMSEEKRVHLAIEYFKETIEENKITDWIFEIYGDGELADSIKEKVKDDKYVFYKGRTDKVNEVLLEGSLLVLTSSFEGMPLVVLEANECGVPVLAYDFGESSSEVIKNGKTGVLVAQNDKEAFKKALLELLSNEKYREELSVQAKNFAKSFAKENIGSQWLDLFEEMNNRRSV